MYKRQVTNSAVGVASTYSGVASATAPGTNYVISLKAAGAPTKKATFSVVSYNTTNDVLTNPTVAAVKAYKNVSSIATNVASVYLPATNFVPSATGSNYLISYASVNDEINTGKTNFLGNLPILLSYNGNGGAAQVGTIAVTNSYVTLGDVPTTNYVTNFVVQDAIDNGIKNGSYTYWNYEHLIRGTSANAAADTVFTQNTNKVIGAVAAPNLNSSDLNVTRQDGGYTIYNK